MGLLGKILIVLNILAGGGFTYIALLDWEVRQKWTFAGFRHELYLQGLPVPASPDNGDSETVGFDFQYGTSSPISELKTDTLNQIFAASQGGNLLGGQPVASQTEEVRRVQALVQQLLAEADGPVAKVQLLRRFLINQAPDGENRDQHRAWLDNPTPENLQAAEAALLGLFEEVITAIPSGPDANANETQRAKIAHLLYHLDSWPNPWYERRAGQEAIDRAQEVLNWRKRVLTVVGLEMYGKIVQRQADQFAEMNNRMQALLRSDLAAFLGPYNDRVQLIKSQADFLDRIDRQREGKLNDRAAEDKIVRARKAERNNLLARLDAVNRAVEQENRQLEAAEARLYRELTRLRQTQDLIQSLEQKLRVSEQAFVGGQ